MMDELRQTQAELAQVRNHIEATEGELQKLRTLLAQITARLTRLEREGLTPNERPLAEALREKARLEAELKATRAALRDRLSRAAELAEHFVETSDSDELAGLADGHLPFLLLPVRIETRFFKTEGGGELRVRIFPDNIEIEAHEPELTAVELSAGQNFWLAYWEKRAQENSAQEPWRRLLAAFDSTRAAWIVHRTTPANLESTDPEPAFPEVSLRPESWSRAAHSRVLPDRWVVIGYSGSQPPQQVFGRPIPDPLQVGPSPDEDVETLDDLPLDRQVEWLIDFDKAEALGMAVRLAFADPAAYERGFDRLMVLGVKASTNPQLTSQLVAQLIEAHRFTGGFALMPQGTPTNNTPEGRSGYSVIEQDNNAVLERLLGNPQYEPADETEKQKDGQRLSTAFGLDRIALERTAHAGGTEERNARSMAAALWPVTWGYYLEQLVGDKLSPATIRAARTHFINFTRGRGPLAAIRVGDMPYGVLPVGAFSQWQTADDQPFETQLVNLLQKLWDRHWRSAAEKAPHVQRDAQGNPTGDPEDTLVSMLGMQAASSSYKVRQLVGGAYTWNLMSLMDNPLKAEIWETHQASTKTPLESLDLADTNPRLADASYDPASHAWRRALIQPGPLSETEPLTFNYLHWLRTASINQIRQEDFGEQKRPKALLYVLLRHVVLLTYVETGYKIKAARQLINESERLVPELVKIQEAETKLTPWEHLAVNVPDLTGRLTLDNYLVQPELPALPELNELAEVKQALAHLETLPTAELERLLTETLDTASHRLDAWLTSLATKRLAQMRDDDHQRGVHLGAFGWVEDLRPAEDLEQARAGAIVDPPGPVMVDRSNDGFMLAPSVNQASTAAILRSGFLTHAAADDVDRFATNLSSKRVRRALWLLQGIQQGQSPAALLGYRFERGLHENNQFDLDEYIYAFRELYPLMGGSSSSPTTNASAQAAANVVNGKRLLDRWRLNKIPYGFEVSNTGLRLPDQGTPQQAAIEAELSQIADDLDALGDIGLAESVYQMILGNQDRAGAILDTVAGQARPQEPEVIRTPRTGLGLTHRVMLLLTGSPPLPAGWETSPRDVAAPALNRWVGQMLGDANRIQCQVTATRPDESVSLQTVSLADLRIAPLDFIYMSGLEGPAGATELEGRILYQVLRNQPPSTQATITFTRDSDWGLEMLSFPEVLELARRLRETVTSTRPLEPADFALPEEEGPTADLFDMGELKGRAIVARNAATDAETLLENALAFFPESDFVPDPIPELDTLRQALLAALAVGIPGALPGSAAGNDVAIYQALIPQGHSVLRELKGRNAAATESFQLFEDIEQNIGDPEVAGPKMRNQLIDTIQSVLGAAFRVLPRFLPRQASETNLALNHPGLLDPADPDAPLRWFQQVSRVSPALSRYEMVTLLAETLSGQTLNLRVGQLPFQETDRWLGLPLTASQEPTPGRVSLLVHTPLGFSDGTPFSGLFLDHFQERIPNVRERTGISLHFNQPGARAPQTILLAAPPQRRSSWQWQDLVQTVYDTLDLAKIRAVDTETLTGLGHYLPGIFLSYNPEDDAVSTDMLAHTYSVLDENN